MASELKVGTRYLLQRQQARDIEITYLVSWLEPNPPQRNRSKIRHYLFSMSKRQASRYGRETGPKLLTGHVYDLKRSGASVLPLRLMRSAVGAEGVRYLWFRKKGKARPI